jgi:hypothetical protein
MQESRNDDDDDDDEIIAGLQCWETIIINFIFIIIIMNLESAIGIATGYGLDDQGVGYRLLMGSKLSLLHIIQTGTGAHPSSHTKRILNSFRENKEAGLWILELPSASAEVMA